MTLEALSPRFSRFPRFRTKRDPEGLVNMTEDTAAAVSETDPSDPSTPQTPVETSTLPDSSGSSRQTRPRLKAWPLSLEAELYTPIHCSNCKGYVVRIYASKLINFERASQVDKVKNPRRGCGFLS